MTTPVHSCTHVVDHHAPICLATHEKNAWHMTCGAPHPAEEARETTLEALIRDPDIAWLAQTLPEEWEAHRATPAAPWIRHPLDESLIVELP